MTNDVIERTLVALEREGWEALCRADGAAFYGEVMTDEGVMVLANGQVMDRDEVVSALGASPPWASYEMTDVRAVPAGEATVALVYRGAATPRSGPTIVCTMTSVYRRDGERWRLALYTQTPVPPAT